MEGRLMILLEGNIGAGKSTLGAILKESGLFEFIPEPVEHGGGDSRPTYSTTSTQTRNGGRSRFNRQPLRHEQRPGRR